MSYASQDDLIERYGRDELVRLTDRKQPASGQLDANVVQAALDDADATINSYIALRIATPVNPVPRALVSCASALARYALAKDRATDRMRADYEDALAWLKQIAQGLVSIGDTAVATTPPNAGTPQIAAPTRVFTKDTLKGF